MEVCTCCLNYLFPHENNDRCSSCIPIKQKLVLPSVYCLYWSNNFVCWFWSQACNSQAISYVPLYDSLGMFLLFIFLLDFEAKKSYNCRFFLWICLNCRCKCSWIYHQPRWSFNSFCPRKQDPGCIFSSPYPQCHIFCFLIREMQITLHTYTETMRTEVMVLKVLRGFSLNCSLCSSDELSNVFNTFNRYIIWI